MLYNVDMAEEEEHTLPVGPDGDLLSVEEIYATLGFVKIWDYKLGWIIVHADDHSKLWPKRRQFQYYYPPSDEPKP